MNYFKDFYLSPLGKLTLIASKKSLVTVSTSSREYKKIPLAKHHPVLKKCRKQLKEYFSGKRKNFSLPLDLKGTPFQKKVWSVLLKIPYGQTWSYLKQAKTVGNSKAVRAVAAANGQNPVGIIVPCHRVIASTQHLHGYAGGLYRKKILLEVEGLKIKNNKIRQP